MVFPTAAARDLNVKTYKSIEGGLTDSATPGRIPAANVFELGARKI